MKNRFTKIISGVILCAAAINTGVAATFSIINNDGAGVGLNDATAVAAVTGNAETTLGAQRLFAMQAAANFWGNILQSNITINIEATMAALSCSTTFGTLGSAGPKTLIRDFTNAPVAGTFYAAAQADSLANSNLGSINDIVASFNRNVGTTGCLDSVSWSYAIGGTLAAGEVSFFDTVLHEIGHGIGFLTIVDISTGVKSGNFDDAFMLFLRDETSGKAWKDMTDSERVASAINSGNLTWSGTRVINAMTPAGITAGTNNGRMRMFAPNPLQLGSSVSHWDTEVSPDELMEPLATPTSDHLLTLSAFQDMGWPMQGDLTITKTNGTTTINQGANTTYTITVTNNSAGDLTIVGATVTDTFSGDLSSISWTCAASTGASCTTNGTGNISDTVTIPKSGTVTYTVTATLSGTATGSLVNTATVAMPSGITDLNTGDNSATDTDTITTTANQAPNGTIDSPATNVTITQGSSVSFMGTGTDPDNNNPLTFAWDFNGGATNSTVEDPGSVTFNTVGVFNVTFTVTDSLALADPTPASVTVTVNAPANQAPNGTIDTPATNQTITVGQSVNFTGTGTDPDNNNPVTFAWDFNGGATNSTVEDPGNVTFNTAGTFNVTLTVTDSLALADPTPATVTITVNAAANQAPNGVIDAPAVNQAITVGQSVNFMGTGTDPDGNNPLTFAWDFNGGAANSTVEDPGNVTFNSVGTFNVTFTVTDSLALADPTPATVTITVTAGNQAPNGVINTPAANVAITTGQSVNFTGTGTDPDNNNPLTFAWDFNGGATNSTAEDPGNVTFNTAGTYNVTFTVTDGLALADPTPATVTVTVSDNQAPNGVIDSPAANVMITQGTTLNLLGTGTDPDGHVPLTFQWALDAVPFDTAEDAGNLVFNNVGTFTLTFTVTDNLGLVDPTPDTRTITVVADSDGDGVADSIESNTADRDGDGVVDSQDYDPTGYFYDEADGRIIAGGRIFVNCNVGTPQFINGLNGNNGHYQFIVTGVGSPSICDITLAIPVGYNLSNNCLNLGELDVNPGPAVQNLGSNEQLNTGILANRTCAANPFHLRLRINPGDAFVLNNNIPLTQLVIAPPAAPIPTLSEWMLLILSALMLLTTLLWMRQQKQMK